MLSKKCDQVKIINESWRGKYIMACDAIFEGRLVTNLTVEAMPPVQDAQAFFPFQETDLSENEKGMIETALLTNYYGIDIEDNEIV